MEKYYGILMNTKIIGELMAVYIPSYILEGDLEKFEDKYSFIDNMYNSYVLTTSNESMSSDLEKSVGCIITESDLLKKYKGMTVDEAKKQYFDDMCEFVWIGRSSTIDEDKVILSQIEVNNFNDEYSDCLDIDDNDLEKILNTNDVNQLKSMLKNLYIKYKGLNMQASDNKLILDDDIIINSIYGNVNVFLKLNDSVSRNGILFIICQNLARFYNDLCNEKASGESNEKIDEAISFLESAIQKIDAFNEIKSIEKCNDLLKKYMRENKNAFLNIISFYNFKNKEINELSQQLDVEIEKMIEIKKFSKDKIRLDIKKMKKYLDEVIIGQEEAKKDVIQAIFMNQLIENHRDKSSILLIGPTGSGKTLIAETIGKYLDRPMIIMDTTQLTTPGYAGASLENFLVRLYNMSNGDLEKAQSAIVVLDEIDKKGVESSESLFGQNVLNTLLPFIEGTTYDLNIQDIGQIQFDTSNLTIIATGAFANVASKMQKNKIDTPYKSNNIGFGSEVKQLESSEDIKYDKITVEDLVKYGKMPNEFIGRFSTITQLTGHTKESLKGILTQSKASALLLEKEKMSKVGIKVEWDEEYIDTIVTKALKLKTGARSLKSTVEYSIKEARWEALLNSNEWRKIILTKECVDDNLNCIIENKKGKRFILKNVLDSRKEKEDVPVKVKMQRR